jgi:acetyl-CoA carboxylase biotin carboxylase subunit
VEFLLDKDKNFYFLEMNTRLQVEHPVTELVSGLDLVHWQIRIAANEELSIKQEDVQLRGHAIECRIYAEDPDNQYFPSPGNITLLQEPSGPGIRIDSGIYEGWTVPTDYDPLLAKLIGYGEDRAQAISRLRRALDEMFVGGIQTNLSLFRRILSDPYFGSGKIDTGYLDRLPTPGPDGGNHRHAELAVIAAGLFAMLDQAETGEKARQVPRTATGDSEFVESRWKRAARIGTLNDSCSERPAQRELK